MKTKILMVILVSLLVILVVSPGIPAGNKAAERGQGTGGKDAKAPEIEVVTFVNTPYWTSPPWYPPEEETTKSHSQVRLLDRPRLDVFGQWQGFIAGARFEPTTSPL